MKLQGIIFDIDGTLLDSNDLHARAWREAFQHFGKEIPLDLLRTQMGKGGDLLVPDLLNGREMRRFGGDLRDYRRKIFKDRYIQQITPLAGVREALIELHEGGLRLALASSAEKEEVRHYLELMDLGELLDGTTSKDDAEFSKPSPEIFSAALELLGTDAGATITVGDTPYDVLASHRASLTIAAVLSGGFDKEDLAKAEFRPSGRARAARSSRGDRSAPRRVRGMDELLDRARSVHRTAISVDGHCDTPYRLRRQNLHLDQPNHEAQVNLQSLLSSGLSASFFVSYVPPAYAGRGAARFADDLIDIIEDEAARFPEALTRANSSSDIRAAKRAGKVALLIGIEGGHAIEDSLETLERFYRRGARYLTLTHVNTNNWADSSGDEGRHGGLTTFGRDVVRTMNDLGMIVDVSHAADSTFYHALETSRVPVVASHSSCRALARHPRNLTDAMLKDLASAGGVCMINFFSAFIDDQAAQTFVAARKGGGGHDGDLPDDEEDWQTFNRWFERLNCPAGTLDQVADHVVHAASVAGVEAVGIGSDFDGVPMLPEGLKSIDRLPWLTARLLARGFSEDELSMILGGNFMRAFEAIERGAR